MHHRSFLLLVLLALPISGICQGRTNARSMVISENGIVATSHYLASQAGARALANGGTAIDAAITANAVLNVTEPMMNGMGGDLFLLYWDAKSQKLYGLNASGWAPKGLTPEYLQKKGATKMPYDGIDAVTVPGVVDGWSKAHQKFGKLPWKDLFQPAIYYAEHGYAVPEMIAGFWKAAAPVLKSDEAKRVFLPGGKPLAVGEKFSNPDVAKALRLVAEQGRDAFYKGTIAQAILETSKSFGGTMTAEDLSEFSSEWVEPISIDYRGWKIYQIPPNAQGMAVLEMMGILSNFEPAKDGPISADELHTRIEAMKLAYADLYKYNADPKFAKVPVQELLSKSYLAKRAALIDPNKANCSPEAGAPTGTDTTYLAAVDKDGNIASLIQSNYNEFGSGIAVKGMGFMLQNRGALFSLDPQSPNVLQPRKRPFHTIIPGFMERGDVHIGFGIMGGSMQPLSNAQFLSNFIDYGMNIQAALEQPRFIGSQKTCNIGMESRVPPEVRDALTKKGHEIDLRGDYSSAMGRGQVVMHDSKSGMNYAASDARADGTAEIEPVNYK